MELSTHFSSFPDPICIVLFVCSFLRLFVDVILFFLKSKDYYLDDDFLDPHPIIYITIYTHYQIACVPP